MLGIRKIPCAWCPQEDDAQDGDSHGICSDHAGQMLAASAQRQFDKVPSYVGERHQFEQYKEKKNGK